MATVDRDQSSRTRQVFFYFGPMTLLVYLVMPHGYLLDFATSFMLKNQLHATATEVSNLPAADRHSSVPVVSVWTDP